MRRKKDSYQVEGKLLINAFGYSVQLEVEKREKEAKTCEERSGNIQIIPGQIVSEENSHPMSAEM